MTFFAEAFADFCGSFCGGFCGGGASRKKNPLRGFYLRKARTLEPFFCGSFCGLGELFAEIDLRKGATP